MTKNRKDILKDVLIPICVLISALMIWQFAAWLCHARITPIVTIGTLFDVLGEGVFWRSLGGTFLRALIAFIISFVLALVLAIAASYEDILHRVLSPIVTVIRSLPTMAVVLIFILTVSSGVTTVLVGTLVLFPTFYSALYPSAKGISKDLIEISLVCGATKLQRLRYVYLPSMAPSIAENGISGLSLSVKLVVSAEVLAQTARSVGMMMMTARAYLETDRLIALTVIVVITCIIIDMIGKIAVSFLNVD